MRTLILALDMVLISMVTILNLLDLDLFLKIISSVLIAALSNIMNLKVYVRFPCLILPMVIKDSLLRLNTEDISVIHVILILRMISLLNLKILEWLLLLLMPAWFNLERIRPWPLFLVWWVFLNLLYTECFSSHQSKRTILSS